MTKPIYFKAQNFIDSVVEDMKLGEVNSPTLYKIRQMIEERLAHRVMTTFMTYLGTKEMDVFAKLMEDHPEITEIDALIMMAPEIPGLKEGLEKNIDSLHKELTYDAQRVETALNAK